MKKKYILLLGVAAVIFVVAAFLASRQPAPPPPPILPTPTPSPIPTTPKTPLSLKAVYPRSGTVELGNTQNAISLVFSQPINIATLRVSISPSLPITLVARKDNPAGVIILPKDQWGTTTYTIQIAAGLESVSKEAALPQDIILRYQMVFPPPPQYGTQEGAF